MGQIGFTRDNNLLTYVGHSICERWWAVRNPKLDVAQRGLRPDIQYLYNRPIGVTMGRYHWQFFCKPEEEDGHILGTGRTGDQKTTSQAIPTALSWRGPAFIVDIKGDITAAVKPFRTHYKELNPNASGTWGFDPLWKLRESKYLHNEISKIALRFIPKPKDERNRFFVDSARNIFAAVIQNFYGKGYSFIDMIDILKGMPTRELVALLHKGGNEEARSKVKELVGAPDPTFHSISQELSTYLSLYYDSEQIRDFYSRAKRFVPSDIEVWDAAIIVSQDELDNWQHPINYILTDVFDYLYTRPDGIHLPILLILDEFTNCGYFPKMASYISTLRSKKVTMLPIVQGPEQIEELYGVAVRRILFNNTRFVWTLGVNEPESADYLSRCFGGFDKVQENQSFMRDEEPDSPEARVSQSVVRRPLVDFDDLKNMKNEVFVLSPTGFHRLTKTRFDDPVFCGRFKRI